MGLWGGRERGGLECGGRAAVRQGVQCGCGADLMMGWMTEERSSRAAEPACSLGTRCPCSTDGCLPVALPACPFMPDLQGSRPEPGGQVRGADQVWARPDPGGARGQAGPGDRQVRAPDAGHAVHAMRADLSEHSTALVLLNRVHNSMC